MTHFAFPLTIINLVLLIHPDDLGGVVVAGSLVGRPVAPEPPSAAVVELAAELLAEGERLAVQTGLRPAAAARRVVEANLHE